MGLRGGAAFVRLAAAMLTLERLQRIHLHERPAGQIVVAKILGLNYRMPPRTEIVVEGAEVLRGLPSVFFAMNHTDRYNYWPFQYEFYRTYNRFTATWVKGKYYEKPATATFLDWCNNIPMPSRGYVVTTEYRRVLGALPGEGDYRLLRDLVDHRREPDDALVAEVSADARRFMHVFAGRDGAGGPEDASLAREVLVRFDEVFDAMTREVLRINREAVTERNLCVLVFPEGTRSHRLGKGHSGLVQVAQALGTPIVPIGCSGSDKVYPTNNPFAKGGRVVYRIGRPLAWDGPELSPHRVRAAYLPLSRQAGLDHGEAFAAATQVVMNAINELVDPEYRMSDDPEAGVKKGVRRFV